MSPLIYWTALCGLKYQSAVMMGKKRRRNEEEKGQGHPYPVPVKVTRIAIPGDGVAEPHSGQTQRGVGHRKHQAVDGRRVRAHLE